MRNCLLKVVAFTLSIMVLAGVLLGCANKNLDKSNSDKVSNENKSNNNSTQDKNSLDKSGDLGLPIVKDPLILTYYTDIGFKAASIMKNWGEIEAWKELEKITGIHIEFIHAPVGQEKEHFNLMLASNDLPDLISYNWRDSFPGGPNKALQDGIAIELNELVNKYAPNFSKLMEENPDWRKQAVTDEGKYYMMPFIRGADINRTISGFQIRKDWLDKLSLHVPTTIEEWYEVLKAFKAEDPNGNGKPDEIPMLTHKGGGFFAFMLAYGLTTENNGFFNDNGKVKYSYIQPEYKEFLMTMRQWYAEGLIDPDYPTIDKKTVDAKMTSDIGGADYGGAGSGFMGLHMKVMIKDKKHPTFKVVAAPYPKTKDGKMYGMKDYSVPGVGVVISSANKHPKESIRMLDYCYSPQGYLLMNFGPEDKAYKMVDGKPQYTDLVLNNPDGLTFDLAALKYGMAPWNGPFVQAGYYWETAVSSFPEATEAIKTWMPASTELRLPPVTPSENEAQKLASILNEVNTYTQEMRDKFIMGLEPMENFDKYVDNVKKMGIEEALKILQDALDRYNNR